jgi:hypothetical protein
LATLANSTYTSEGCQYPLILKEDIDYPPEQLAEGVR